MCPWADGLDDDPDDGEEEVGVPIPGFAFETGTEPRKEKPKINFPKSISKKKKKEEEMIYPKEEEILTETSLKPHHLELYKSLYRK